MHAGGRLLGHAPDARRDLGVTLRILGQRAGQQLEDDAELLRVRSRRVRNRAGQLELAALVNQQRGVAAVVEDHVRAAVEAVQGLLGAPPILLERLALPRVDRHALRVLGGAVRADDNGRRGVILGREDVAGHPANLGTQRDQSLDQHRRLDRHVQRAHDLRARQRLGVAVLAAGRHQARHLMLGQTDLVAAELGQGQIGDLEVQFCGGCAHARVSSTDGCVNWVIRCRSVTRALTSSKVSRATRSVPNSSTLKDATAVPYAIAVDSRA